MKHIKNTNININENTVITLGNFDGVHKGHKLLIEKLLELKNSTGYKSVIFTFFPHPVFVLNKKSDMELIFTEQEKYAKMKDYGIDYYIEYPFTEEFSKTDPEAFFVNLIIKKLNCKILIIGDDFKFGCNKSGNAFYLREIGKKYNVQVIIIPSLKYKDKKIGSTEIRQYLLEKDIETANYLLGENYSITGEVVHGRKIGKSISFPTANIIPERNKLLPPNGVYITLTDIDGKIYKSITNIGYNPTVLGKIKTVETHILNFDMDLYGKYIKVMFLSWIRNEKKFGTLDDLKNQIRIDKQKAEKYFEKI